ncbi:MAG: methyltransferase domain-containing protein [Candidatus Eisenbacteria bacterium]
MPHRDERWVTEKFTARYGAETGDVLARIEQQVIGGAWGANGYTTRAQALELGQRLGLAPGMRLCDLGSGRGWPGLFLAHEFGCSVVLTDLPREGLAIASRTAQERRLAARAAMVVTSARALPLRSAAFDAVVHTDVLC